VVLDYDQLRGRVSDEFKLFWRDLLRRVFALGAPSAAEGPW